MWDMFGWLAWIVSALIFIWLVYDFFIVNKKFGEDVLLSSREGVDELFPMSDQPTGEM